MLGCDELYEECKEIMLINLSSADNYVIDDIEYSGGMQPDNQKSADILIDFKREMIEIVKNKKEEIISFDYNPDNLKNFESCCRNNKMQIYESHKFVKNLDIDKFRNMIIECNSEQIDELRGIFMSVYSAINIKESLTEDKDNLCKIKDIVEELINEKDMDKIKRKQLQWFVKNLDGIIKKYL